MRYWLSRLSLALLAMAFVLGWPAWRALRGGEPMEQWRIVLQLAAAAACIVCSMLGAHYRHQGH